MGELEVKQQTQVNNSSSTIGTGSSGTRVQTQNGKPTIFAGMTKAEAQEYGLLDEFNKANTDGDEKLSETEYTNATTKKESSSTTYTVKQGDTLSTIAHKFGVDVFELYEANKSIIGGNMNRLMIGQELKINTANAVEHEHHDDCEETHHEQECDHEHCSTGPKIFAGMTREQAEKIGGETLKAFNTFANGENKITLEQFKKYNAQFKEALNPEYVKLMANLDIENDPEAFQKLLKLSANYVDLESADCNFEGKSLKEAFQTFGVTKEVLEEAGIRPEDVKANNENFIKFLNEFIREKQQNDINDTNSENYQKHYERLANGEFTWFEMDKLGLNPDVPLTDEQLKQYTAFAIKHQYEATLAMIATSNCENKEDFELLCAMAKLMPKLEEVSDNAKVVTENLAYANIKQASTNAIAKGEISTEEANTYKAEILNTMSEIKYGDETNGVSNEVAIMNTKTVMQAGSEENINKILENNPERADIIKEVAEYVILSTTDENKKAILQNVVEQATQIIETGSSDGISKTGRTSGSTGVNGNNTVSGGNSSGAYTTSPISQSETPLTNTTPTISTAQQKNTQQVADIRTASQNLYNSNPIEQPKTLSAQEKLIQKILTLFKEHNIDFQKLKNLPVNQAIGEIIGIFDQLPGIAREKIIGQLKRMNPATLCEAYIDGGEARNFIKGEQLLDRNYLYNYLAMHPSELKKADDNIQTEFVELREKRTAEPYDPTKFTENLRNL